jgi:hypothetical protein
MFDKFSIEWLELFINDIENKSMGSLGRPQE